MTKKKRKLLATKKAEKKLKRECWSLDDSFYYWLLDHLRVYLRDASVIIDLDYRILTVDDVSLTQREAIEHIIKQIEKILFLKDSLPTELIAKGDYISYEEINKDYEATLNNAMAWWTKILPYMWW